MTERERSDRLAVQRVRAAMLARNWAVRDLAKATGFHPKRVTNCMTLNERCWPLRCAINEAFGEQFFDPPVRRWGCRAPAPRKKSKPISPDVSAPQPDPAPAQTVAPLQHIDIATTQ